LHQRKSKKKEEDKAWKESLSLSRTMAGNDDDDGESSVLRVCMLGLSDAGKTTLLYKQKLGAVPAQIQATNGYNVEALKFRPSGDADRRADITVWDVGGAAEFPRFKNTEKTVTRHGLWTSVARPDDVDALWFVVAADSTPGELTEARAELEWLRAEVLASWVAIAILVNNRNDDGAAASAESLAAISSALSVDEVPSGSGDKPAALTVVGVNAKTGEGVDSLMSWTVDRALED
jgi:GTPase Era involved in 16S rRNA processing